MMADRLFEGMFYNIVIINNLIMKSVSKWIATFAVIVVLSAGAMAQTVDDVINKHIDAIGGKDKLIALKTLYQESSMQIMGQDMPMKIWISNGLGMRTEMEMMGQKMIVAVNKDKGWMINPMTGSTDPQDLPAEQVKQSMAQMELGGPLFNYKTKGYTATLLGKEKVGSNDCYKIKLTKDKDVESTYYIDATTYYIDKTDTKINANGNEVQVGSVFSDYKKSTDGYVFAYTTTVTNQMGEIVSKITKLDINKPMDSKLFEGQ